VKIDSKTVAGLAHLSRLSLNEDQNSEMCNELNKMLDFVEVLSELDTDTVEPLIFLNESEAELREDQVILINSRAEILSNAPKHNDSFFMLPKFVDK
jgi:aspartyl-tRNA(Asn)/glutamyl-tRNA(Gln) amidotransferase subunit C